ncbi:putative diphthamide synthesis protein-domain-containing protein [Rhexocercosporidium sp. MPI-PUGE-AT-0058]|nr:putative diphthamide synthesis protein-domain-containing protein [Rhexocercosporidium sp. MPI-PUGE-AT-0058]
MTAPQPTQAPVLSTPESHIFEDPTPSSFSTSAFTQTYNEEEFREIFEIERTVRDVTRGRYRRVALQFPDGMLGVAGRVVGALEEGCESWREGEDGDIERGREDKTENYANVEELETGFNGFSASESVSAKAAIENGHTPSSTTVSTEARAENRIRFYILADTSYGSCCVDEIAAEHVSADVVIHYGRSCLSPTTRLPVIYIYTSQPLSIPLATSSFVQTFPDTNEKVSLMADITYQIHIPKLVTALREKGYANLTAPEVVRDPASVVPNRLVEEGVREKLAEYALWHVSEPPKALLLTLASRVREMYIYPTTTSQTSSNSKDGPTPQAILANTSLLLRRRYALLTTLSTAPILGILINTLSVSDHLSALSALKELISRAGKKSYTFVVGKVNAAKLANFSEIGGWVVVGCWESSLIEGGDFYKGVVTPFELSVALKGLGRGWDGSWRGDFGGLDGVGTNEESVEKGEEEMGGEEKGTDGEEQTGGQGDEDSESESEPPVYDLRTGRYISNSRPIRTTTSASQQTSSTPSSQATEPKDPQSKSLTRRAKGDLATINGTVSPGAEFLRTQRTWTGLGSDFAENEAPDGIEEGRRGVARGYVVGDGGERR